jgi:hypothetical protein
LRGKIPISKNGLRCAGCLSMQEDGECGKAKGTGKSTTGQKAAP